MTKLFSADVFDWVADQATEIASADEAGPTQNRLARDSADRLRMSKLMPYEHLLPKALRGRNERLAETIADRGEPRELRAG